MTLKQAHDQAWQVLHIIYEADEARAIISMLLEFITGLDKKQLFSNLQHELDNAAQKKLQESLNRLQAHEPVQYVISEAWFYGSKFYVDKNVLIPRPETEELVDWIINDLKSAKKIMRVLDIGTGSGCIPVSIKKALPQHSVDACDISENALQVAMKNSKTLNAPVNFIRTDFLNEKERNSFDAYDIIISNPPYIPGADKNTMDKNVTDHEPHLALFVPDHDGLIFYRAIADFCKTHLKQNGAVYLEVYEKWAAETSAVFTHHGFTTIIKKDMQGKERMIKASHHL